MDKAADANTDANADAMAQMLIDMLFCALRDLNQGHPMPPHWRASIAEHLGPKGKPGPKPKNADIGREIANRMFAWRLKAGKNPEAGAVSRFADVLAEEFTTSERTWTREYVFKAEAKFNTEAWVNEFMRRLKEADARLEAERIAKAEAIDERMGGGESLDQILDDPRISMDEYAEIHNAKRHDRAPFSVAAKPSVLDYPQRRENIMRWLAAGFSLSLDFDPPERQALYKGLK